MRHNLQCFDLDVGYNRHNFDNLIGVVLYYNSSLYHEVTMQSHLATANSGFKHCILHALEAPGVYPPWRLTHVPNLFIKD